MKDKILRYIKYLEETHHLSISVHFSQTYMKPLSTSINALLGQYNFHKNPYCFYIKKNREQQRKCILCQRAVLRKCAGCERYEGTCHAGVREYIERIMVKDGVVGFVSVSGYKDKSVHNDSAWYNSLSDKEVPFELLSVVISPLCVMLAEYAGSIISGNTTGDIYLQIISYLEEYHNVSLEDICRRFGYSKSYISHLFKKRCGCTLRHYCNMLKIRDAKLLLERSNMSITDISYAAGFNNFSYFINVFKNITGKTPLAWRKKK